MQLGSKILVFIIDPLGQTTVTAGRDNCYRTCCPSATTFQNLAKPNKVKTMFAHVETVGLAEWIIECSLSCILICIFLCFKIMCTHKFARALVEHKFSVDYFQPGLYQIGFKIFSTN